jgi:Rtf2 RING-finger
LFFQDEALWNHIRLYGYTVYPIISEHPNSVTGSLSLSIGLLGYLESRAEYKLRPKAIPVVSSKRLCHCFDLLLPRDYRAIMGGDGGVLPTGRKFIRGCGKSVEDKKEDGKNVTKAQIMRTTICAQSSEPLVEPIIACEMGNLYSREAMLLAFINKTLNPLYSHVRGMKDVRTLKLTQNSSFSVTEEAEENSRPRYMCPVTSMELNGVHPFVVIWSTGFVLSEKAVREIGIDGLQQDYGPFGCDDIVHLVPKEDEIEAQKGQMDLRRENILTAKGVKKESKKSKRVSDIVNEVQVSLTANSATATIDVRDQERCIKRTKNEFETRKSTGGDASRNFLVASSAGSAVSLTSATSVARKAQMCVESQETKSKVFKDLFHKGHEADKYDRDLFMSISGLRYSLR